jgi:hypothetical protein
VNWNTLLGSWPDGSVTLMAQARNAFGMIGLDLRTVVVDNYAPNVSPAYVVTVPTATAETVPMMWAPSTDGNLEVPQYYLTVFQQGLTSTEDLATWAVRNAAYPTPSRATTDVPYTLATTPFSRHVVRVKGCGPRWNASSNPSWTSADAESARFYSRPRLSVGHWESMDHEIRVSTPTFNTVVAPYYTWYVDTDPGTGWTGWTEVALEHGASLHVPESETIKYRYRVKVDFTPTDGVAATTGSQVLAQAAAHDHLFSAPADWTPWW